MGCGKKTYKRPQKPKSNPSKRKRTYNKKSANKKRMRR